MPLAPRRPRSSAKLLDPHVRVYALYVHLHAAGPAKDQCSRSHRNARLDARSNLLPNLPILQLEQRVAIPTIEVVDDH